ncbi:MAG: hypothetical protein K2H95_09325, partial [Bacteroidales bacterium]|nr:hypothetical protein [Bacteroidales bacterium]
SVCQRHNRAYDRTDTRRQDNLMRKLRMEGLRMDLEYAEACTEMAPRPVEKACQPGASAMNGTVRQIAGKACDNIGKLPGRGGHIRKNQNTTS